MKFFKSAVLIIALTLMSLSAQAYSLSADWDFNNNPNGTWTVGTYNGLDTGSFTAFAVADKQTIFINDAVDGSLTAELQVYRGAAAIDPNIIKNVGDTVTTACCSEITFNADAVTFGPFHGAAVARWTAPTTGTYLVDASFATVQVGNAAGNAYVFNGTSLIDLGSLAAAQGYNNQISLTAGTIFDFIVWGGDTNNKTTEVSATITALPEPGTLGMGLLGFGLLAWIRRSIST